MSKMNDITEITDLTVLTMDELIENIQIYKLNRKQGSTMNEGMKETSVALEISSNNGTDEEDEMANITRRLQKIIKKHGDFQKKGSTSRATNANDLCHK